MSQPIGFDDKVDIGETLVAPKDHSDQLSDQIALVEGWLGTIEDGWQWMFGWSILEYIFVPIAGNWGVLLTYAEGWETLGEAADGVRTNVAHFTDELRQTWRGRAADAFGGYMAQWDGSLAAERSMCDEMHSAVKDLSDNSEALINFIVDSVNLIVDVVLIALKCVSLAKAIKKGMTAYKRARKTRKIIEDIIAAIDTVVVYFESLAIAIEEANDNQTMPNGEVGVPDAPGTSKHSSGATKGEGNPAPTGD